MVVLAHVGSLLIRGASRVYLSQSCAEGTIPSSFADAFLKVCRGDSSGKITPLDPVCLKRLSRSGMQLGNIGPTLVLGGRKFSCPCRQGRQEPSKEALVNR